MVCLSALLFFVTSEEQVILLPPDIDAKPVALLASETYKQEFVVHESSVTRVGVYIRPLAQDLASNLVTLSLFYDDALVHTQTIEAKSFQTGEPTFIVLPKTLSIDPGSTLSLVVTVSDALSNKVAIMPRPQDDTFNTEAKFYVGANDPQNPAGYEVFSAYHPAITLQLGGLALLAAALLFAHSFSFRISKILYSVLLPITAVLPSIALLSSLQGILYLVLTIISLYALINVFRKHMTHIAALFGAHVFVFTSFWPLVGMGGRTIYDSMALSTISHLKDIFLDPNQFSLEKAGAFVGIPSLVIGIVGLLIYVYQLLQNRSWHNLLLTILVFMGGLVSTPILTVAVLSYGAGRGMNWLHNFLGAKDVTTRIILYAVTILTLIDLISVYSTVLARVL